MAGAWTNNWEALKRILATNKIDAGTLINTGGGQITAEFRPHDTKPSMLMDDVNNGSGISTSYVTLRIGGEQSAVTPSASDYNIYGPITSGINYVSIINGTISYDTSTGIASRRDEVTIQNTGSGSKTVYEWGLFGGIRHANGNGSTTAEFLLYRGTLDTPVTLEQFETLTIKFTRKVQITVPQS